MQETEKSVPHKPTKKWFEPEETAFMVGSLQIKEDDDILSWRENGGSKVTV